MLPDFPPNSQSKSSQTFNARPTDSSEVLVAGGGVIGLSVALELERRGMHVTVLERGKALQQASTAAAGMLAAEDPHNSPALFQLARYSLSLYADYLQRIEDLSGLRVPFQTSSTRQYLQDGSSVRVAEHSIDPRQLAAALLAAVRSTSIQLIEETAMATLEDVAGGVRVTFNDGRCFHAGAVIMAAGAWSSTLALRPTLNIIPRKGQMLRVKVPTRLQISEVHRSEQVYIVPRFYGPQAGTALIGATVEDAGFDVATHPAALAGLRLLAAKLLPQFASETAAPTVEAWAGLRPGTADDLPLLGRSGNTIIASGHFRNGILLAPATAAVVAQLYESRPLAVDLSAFAPDRRRSVPTSKVTA